MLIDMGVDHKVVDKSGAWLSYRSERVGQGRENAKAFLKEHPEIAARIEAEILQKHGLGAPAANEAVSINGNGESKAPEAIPKPEPKAKSKNPVGGRRARA